MSTETVFLPAERLSQDEISAQRGEIEQSSVLLAMLDNVPGMVALLNQNRQIVFCNDACVKAGGLAQKEDAFGMRTGELLRCIHASDMKGGCGASESCKYCGFAQALVIGQRGRAHSGECLIQCHDVDRDIHSEYSVEVRPLPQLGSGWVSCTLTDVGDAKRRQALEQIFFHDIMNSASAVEGVSRILADEETPSAVRDRFTRLLSLSSRALVDEIRSQRTLLAAETGELDVENTDCESLEILQAAVAACATFGLAEKKRLELLPDAESILFKTDAALLRRALINMLKNGLEASSAGQTVTATCKMSTPDRICFSVHNDTVMPDRVRAHIFQRSFTTKGVGRGLGTYGIKMLVENYLNGRASFDSIEGQGTTFHVEFAV